jgi:hypothetical protein
VWQYCTFTPEDFEKKKKKFKIEIDHNEIFIPRLFMNERKEVYNKFYGAMSLQYHDNLNLTNEQCSLVSMYRSERKEEI